MSLQSERVLNVAGLLNLFGIFLRLGLTSFGGPIAHLGYFREEFVVRRAWLTDRAYADLVALCQFLPGPASSQVGMAVGLMRAGLPGLCVAFIGFTLPSAVLMVAFAMVLDGAGGLGGAGWVAGLKAAAVAVVCHAVLGMARSLCPERRTTSIALCAAILAVCLPGSGGQLLAIALGALAGYCVLQSVAGAGGDPFPPLGISRRTAVGALLLFAAGLLLLPLAAQLSRSGGWDLAERFFRVGSLVFGGGHVVLPLLDAETVGTGLVSKDAFLAGYGAAQAMPGPLFTFAAFLGAVAQRPPSGLAGASIALLAIFAPSALLVVGAVPFWEKLRAAPAARRLLAGVNAAVVGLLGAALWSVVLPEGVTGPYSFALAAACYLGLAVWQVPAWAVVALAAAAGAVVL
ncbi:chromate efflux transporter [Roseixanthobacter liquoris]|uniref:chromate efflux transporter n=1 Tax=Roseixanthobacter liquoris TaxID=3119921 RepID=UPI003727DB60